MIGLDTNVPARYVAQDDPRQSTKASKLIESLTPAANIPLPLTPRRPRRQACSA